MNDTFVINFIIAIIVFLIVFFILDIDTVNHRSLIISTIFYAFVLAFVSNLI